MAKKDDVEVMGAFPLLGDPAPPKKTPFWKKPVFVLGLTVGTIGFAGILFSVHRKADDVPHGTSVPSAPPLPGPAEGVSKNPEYRRKIAQLNRERTLSASRSGQSVVPTLGGDERAGDIAREEKKAASPPPPPQVTPEFLQEEESRRKAAIAAQKAEEDAVEKAAGGILSSWSSAGEGMDILPPPKSGAPSKASPSASEAARKSVPAGKPGKGIPIIPAGKILYGRIVNELNSDHPGPVLAQAVGGKFDGVKFLGSFQRDHGALVIKFDRAIYPDGETDSVGAFAVSPGAKLRSGLATDVDHHYLYRYGSLLASAFMQGFGQSAMYADSTSYPSAMGMPVIGFNGMTLMQQTEMGLGQAGMMLGGQAMNAFNRPTTVKVAANTPVGLMIVAETGQKMPKSDASTAAAPTKPGLVSAPVPSMVPQPGYPQPPYTSGYPGYGGGYGMPMMPMMP